MMRATFLQHLVALTPLGGREVLRNLLPLLLLTVCRPLICRPWQKTLPPPLLQLLLLLLLTLLPLLFLTLLLLLLLLLKKEGVVRSH